MEQNDRVNISTRATFENRIDQSINIIVDPHVGLNYYVKEISIKGEEIIRLPNGEVILSILGDISESSRSIVILGSRIKSKTAIVIFSPLSFWAMAVVAVSTIPLIFVTNVYSDTGSVAPTVVSSHAIFKWDQLVEISTKSHGFIETIDLLSRTMWNVAYIVPIIGAFAAFLIRWVSNRINPDYSGHDFLKKIENQLYLVGKMATTRNGPVISVSVRLGDRFSNIVGSKIVNRSSSTVM